MIIDSKVDSYIDIDKNSDFPLQNLPWGVFKSTQHSEPRIGVALGDFIIDMATLHEADLIKVNQTNQAVFNRRYLNDFIALGQKTWQTVRQQLFNLFKADAVLSSHDQSTIERALIAQSTATLLTPFDIGDYIDFYSSEHHAFNVGALFRGAGKELMPNWKHLPVGYHGKAGSIITTQQPVYRPYGQVVDKASGNILFQPSQKLDIELEMAFFIGQSSQRGYCIPIKDAHDYIFGMVLLNDWSARDIQQWEYQPLGPFLGKSFATAISPWVVTLDALAPFKVGSPHQEPTPLPYLVSDNQSDHYDINLEVKLKSDKMSTGQVICHSNHRYLYWSMKQQLAHATCGGANVRLGDLMASGTISGPNHNELGSLLEITHNGANPIQLNSGEERKFIEDYDTVSLTGYCQNETLRIGFGTLENQILPRPSS